VTRDYVRGTLAMANSGPNSNGSQFFIVHQNTGLPKQYNIFGMVKEGIEVVDAIASVPTGNRDNPLEDVIMKTVTISES